MPRPYVSTVRAARAAETRRRIVEAAIEAFVEHGYAGTRMADLAARADCSLDTVNANGPKGALLQAAFEVASFGQEGEHLIFEFDLGRQLQDAGGIDVLCDVLANALEALNARVATLWAILTAEALVDDDLADRHEAMLASIIRSTDAFVTLCEDRGWTSAAIPRRERVAAILTAGSPDSYRRLRDGMGWSSGEYRAWVRARIAAALRDRG